MIKKLGWAPRNNMVILEARLKQERIDSSVIRADSDGNNFTDDYEFFVYDKGEEVNIDLEIGDRIYCNYANIKFIHDDKDGTDRKANVTYMMILDQLIDLRKPAPVTI